MKIGPLADPLDDWHEDTSIKVGNVDVVVRLKADGIAPSTSTSDYTKFPLTQSNGPGKRWAGVLLDALERLVETGSNRSKTSCASQSRVSEQNFARKTSLFVDLQVIHEFVRVGVFSELVTPNLAVALRSRYTVGVRKSQTKGMCRNLWVCT